MHAFVVSKSSLLPNGMSSKHLCAHSAACKGTCRLNFCNGSNLWRRFMLCTPDIFLRWSVALRRGMPGYYNPSAYSDYYHNHYYNNPNYPPFPQQWHYHPISSPFSRLWTGSLCTPTHLPTTSAPLCFSYTSPPHYFYPYISSATSFLIPGSRDSTLRRESISAYCHRLSSFSFKF